MEWYYADADDNQLGPVSDSDIPGLINSGVIKRATRVWQEGMDDWAPAASTELQKHLPSSTPPKFKQGSVSAVKYCSACGALVTEGANFCPECGRSADASPASATSQSVSPDVKALEKGRRTIFPGQAQHVDEVASFIKEIMEKEGLVTQIVSDGTSRIVQGRQDDVKWKVILKKVSGLEAAATASVRPQGNNLELFLGAGKWMDKAIGAGIAWFFLWPALLTTGWGIYMQQQLFKKIENGVKDFLIARN